MTSRIATTGTLVLAASLLGACQDLNVPNDNNPDRRRALSQPDAVESLIANSFPLYYGRLHRSSSTAIIAPVVADEMTSTHYTDGRCSPTVELGSEPRGPLNNDPVTCTHDWPEFQWEDFYELAANTVDVLKSIEQNDVKIVIDGVDYTGRTRAFAKMWQGISLGYIGLMFDRGWIVTEDTPDQDIENAAERLDLLPYPQVVAAAEDILIEASDLAESVAAFEVPAAWMYTTANLDNDDIARLSHSYAARIMALSARTAEERDNLDWNAILNHINQGITTDFRVDLAAESSWRSSYLLYAQRSNSTRMYADYKLIGPADVSGKYQDWIAADFADRDKFLITTPDRRITGETPESDGKYFRYQESDPFDAAQGPYFGSYYQWYRNNGSDRVGTWGIITVDEMNLLKAEALLRTGDRAGAAELINLTRVANGELPPVTANGVADAADCVPRDPATGACGTLLQALEHERRIELTGLDAMYTYLDRRGFDSLAPGTLLQLPIPGEQLEILGIERYTFGGNLPWSAQ